MSNNDLEREISGLVSKEKTNLENVQAYVTEKVSFNMRPLIRQLRKNYWGVFDEERDPTTGRKKIWPPLTESFVESVVKNIDLDAKDINFRAKNKNSRGLVPIVKAIVMEALNAMRFGELLDDLERAVAIDGTAVWNITKKKVNGKTVPQIRRVDLLNFYIDPTAPSIQEAEFVIERIVDEVSAVQKVAKDNEWANQEKIIGSSGVHRTDGENYPGGNFQTSDIKFVELFKRVGLAPYYFITGNKEDTQKRNMEIVCSWDGSGMIFHSAELLHSDWKPYEECWYTRPLGRWYGRGVAEKLMHLQRYLNTIFNIRINRSYISQLGINVIRKGSGITQQMISRLAVNGAIVVNDVNNDIKQYPMQDASPASYQDEAVIKEWSRQQTSNWEVSTGESLPVSTTATAVAVQGQNAQSQFSLIKEGIGMFSERVMERHLVPMIFENVKKSDIVRITGDVMSIRKFAEAIANYAVYDAVSRNPNLNDPNQIEIERQRLITQIERAGDDQFVELVEDLDPSQFSVKVYFTNEEFDKAVMVQNLINMLQIVGSNPTLGVDASDIVHEAMTLMGIEYNKSTQAQGQMAPQGTMTSGHTLQSLVTGANTRGNAGQ